MSSKGEAEVGDARIEFLFEGAGDAVVLIPGGGLDASYFDDLARHIAGAGFRAVAVNPRGVGASKGRLEGLTLHTLAGDVAAVIEALGSGPAHVVGHGFSNRVARCLAVDRPDLVRSVILLGGVGLIAPEPEVVRALQAWFGQDTTEADCLEATKQLVADPAAAQQVFRQVKRWPAAAAAQRAADRATPQEDWVEPPNQVSFLIVQGLKDRVAPPEHGHAFRERLGRRVHMADIPDAGHLVFLEQPETVAEAVVSFLRQQAAQTRAGIDVGAVQSRSGSSRGTGCPCGRGALMGLLQATAYMITQPAVALVPCLVLLGFYFLSGKRFVLVVARLWAGYVPYEFGMKLRILCSGECNIRVDLLLI